MLIFECEWNINGHWANKSTVPVTDMTDMWDTCFE